MLLPIHVIYTFMPWLLVSYQLYMWATSPRFTCLFVALICLLICINVGLWYYDDCNYVTCSIFLYVHTCILPIHACQFAYAHALFFHQFICSHASHSMFINLPNWVLYVHINTHVGLNLALLPSWYATTSLCIQSLHVHIRVVCIHATAFLYFRGSYMHIHMFIPSLLKSSRCEML